MTEQQEFQFFCPRLKRHVYFDFYALLRVAPSATSEQIKRSYHELARELHPDKCCAEKKDMSKEKFKIILEAYQTLSDPCRRVQYNNFLSKLELKKSLKKNNLSALTTTILNSSGENQFLLNILKHSMSSSKNRLNFVTDLNAFSLDPNAFLSRHFNQNKFMNPSAAAATTTTHQSSTPATNNSSLLEETFTTDQNNTFDASILSEEQFLPQINLSNNNNNNNNNVNASFEMSSEEGGCSTYSRNQPASPTCSSAESFYKRFSFLNKTRNDPAPSVENFTFLKGIFTPPASCPSARSYLEDDAFYQRFKHMFEENKQAQPSSDWNNSSAFEEEETLSFTQKQQQQQQQKQSNEELAYGRKKISPMHKSNRTTGNSFSTSSKREITDRTIVKRIRSKQAIFKFAPRQRNLIKQTNFATNTATSSP